MRCRGVYVGCVFELIFDFFRCGRVDLLTYDGFLEGEGIKSYT